MLDYGATMTFADYGKIGYIPKDVYLAGNYKYIRSIQDEFFPDMLYDIVLDTADDTMYYTFI